MGKAIEKRYDRVLFPQLVNELFSFTGGNRVKEDFAQSLLSNKDFTSFLDYGLEPLLLLTCEFIQDTQEPSLSSKMLVSSIAVANLGVRGSQFGVSFSYVHNLILEMCSDYVSRLRVIEAVVSKSDTTLLAVDLESKEVDRVYKEVFGLVVPSSYEGYKDEWYKSVDFSSRDKNYDFGNKTSNKRYILDATLKWYLYATSIELSIYGSLTFESIGQRG